MRTLALGLAVALVSGCGGTAPVAVDGGQPGSDAANANDSGSGSDAGSPTDTGVPGSDAGTLPEVCSGGVDEDGDTQTDCADSDCWTDASCIAADVAAHAAPGLTACGDPIEIDAATSAAACAMLGTPMGSTYATECDAGTLTATARVFCDGTGAPAALWLEERLDTEETQRMLSARTFEHTYYERASVVDWERQTSGASTREGATGFPIHETSDRSTAGHAVFHVITVRAVLGGDGLSRLLGMQRIVSVIDLDMPMSMDTRSTLHAGGLTLTVPTP